MEEMKQILKVEKHRINITIARLEQSTENVYKASHYTKRLINFSGCVTSVEKQTIE